VPLGAFLSGGLDSSAIVKLMSDQSTGPVSTFHIRFDEEEYDESRYAAEVAGQIGTSHHEMNVKPDFTEILPRLVWHYSEPFADPSAVPYFYLSQMTAAHVKVGSAGWRR
jgi:asparagine synthase (glutamine-hydrolysing)